MRFPPLVLVLALAGCNTAGQIQSSEPRQVLEDFSMSRSHRSQPAWTLKAKLAILKEEVQQVSLGRPRMEFYSKGQVSSKVESLKGIAHLTTHDILLSKSVVLTSIDEKTTLKTEKLIYSEKRKKFFTQEAVTVSRPGTVVRGRGIEADPQLSEIRIFNQESVIRQP